MDQYSLKKSAVLYIDGKRTEYTGAQQAMHAGGTFYSKDVSSTEHHKRNVYTWIWAGRAWRPRFVVSCKFGSLHTCEDVTDMPWAKECLLKEMLHNG